MIDGVPTHVMHTGGRIDEWAQCVVCYRGIIIRLLSGEALRRTTQSSAGVQYVSRFSPPTNRLTDRPH